MDSHNQFDFLDVDENGSLGCANCLNEFRSFAIDPSRVATTLTCNHSFCVGCIKNLTITDPLTRRIGVCCPMCSHTSWNEPRSSIENDHVMCGNCEKSPATSRCLHCDEDCSYLCPECAGKHNQMKAFRKHEISFLNQKSLNQKSKSDQININYEIWTCGELVSMTMLQIVLSETSTKTGCELTIHSPHQSQINIKFKGNSSQVEAAKANVRSRGIALISLHISVNFEQLNCVDNMSSTARQVWMLCSNNAAEQPITVDSLAELVQGAALLGYVFEAKLQERSQSDMGTDMNMACVSVSGALQHVLFAVARVIDLLDNGSADSALTGLDLTGLPLTAASPPACASSSSDGNDSLLAAHAQFVINGSPGDAESCLLGARSTSSSAISNGSSISSGSGKMSLQAPDLVNPCIVNMDYSMHLHVNSPTFSPKKVPNIPLFNLSASRQHRADSGDRTAMISSSNSSTGLTAAKYVFPVLPSTVSSNEPVSPPPDGNLAVWHMDCPHDRVKLVIGAKGVIIKAIMRRTKTTITINENFPDGMPRLVEIKGRPEQIKAAQQCVQGVIDYGPLFLEGGTAGIAPVCSSPAHVGINPATLIAGGASSSNSSSSSGSVIALGGGGSTEAGRLAASAEVITSSQVFCPTDKISIIIGARGVIIKEISKRSNAQISIDEDPKNSIAAAAQALAAGTGTDNDEGGGAGTNSMHSSSQQDSSLRRIEIRGNSAEIAAAEVLIWAVVHGGPAALYNGSSGPGDGTPCDGSKQIGSNLLSKVTTEISCPKDKVGALIGSKGSVVREIMRRTSTQVSVGEEILCIPVTSSPLTAAWAAAAAAQRQAGPGTGLATNSISNTVEVRMVTIKGYPDEVQNAVQLIEYIIGNNLANDGVTVSVDLAAFNKPNIKQSGSVDITGVAPASSSSSSSNALSTAVNAFFPASMSSAAAPPVTSYLQATTASARSERLEPAVSLASNAICSESVDCPIGKVGEIIGFKGAVIQHLVAQSGAKVIVVDHPFNPSSHKSVEIQGTREQVSVAKGMVTEIIFGISSMSSGAKIKQRPQTAVVPATDTNGNNNSSGGGGGNNKESPERITRATDRRAFSLTNYDLLPEEAINQFRQYRHHHSETDANEILQDYNASSSEGSSLLPSFSLWARDSRSSGPAGGDPKNLGRSESFGGSSSNSMFSFANQDQDDNLLNLSRDSIDDAGDGDSFVHHSIECPNEKVGLIIGSKGIVIKSMMSRSRAKIIVTAAIVNGETVRTVEISGTERQVEAARNMVECVISFGNEALDTSGIASLGLGIVTKHVELTTDAVRFLLSNKGQRLKFFAQESMATISLGKKVVSNDVTRRHSITIKGTVAEVDTAMALIQREIHDNHAAVTACSSMTDAASMDWCSGRSFHPTSALPVCTTVTATAGAGNMIAAVGGTSNSLPIGVRKQRLTSASVDEGNYFTHGPSALGAAGGGGGGGGSPHRAHSIDLTPHSSSLGAGSPTKSVRKLSSFIDVRTVRCPLLKVGSLIGTRGSVIKEIMKRTNAAIVIGELPENSNEIPGTAAQQVYRDVVIRGSTESVVEAEKLVRGVIERGTRSLTNHVLSLTTTASSTGNHHHAAHTTITSDIDDILTR